MISIRLSEEEYKSLKSCYGKYGARNVSDLARLALKRILEVSAPEDQVERRLIALALRVQELELQMVTLLEWQVKSLAAGYASAESSPLPSQGS